MVGATVTPLASGMLLLCMASAVLVTPYLTASAGSVPSHAPSHHMGGDD
jgi:hypothetical protein